MTIVKPNKNGFTVIEILVVVAIMLTAFTAILGLITISVKTSTLIRETTQANFLAQETAEATRNFRSGSNWATNGLGFLTIGIAYHPEKTADIPSRWAMVQGEETVGIFSRKIVFENVYRDVNFNIVGSGGTNDPNTKKATVTISWNGKKVEIITYFTNWQ